jgi:hypothetical protein
MTLRKLSLFGVLFLVPSVMRAEDGASWLRTAASNALNPNISLVGDAVAQFGPGQSNDLSLREVELAINADVDPSTRADFFLALHDGESVELEEGFITLLSLPLGLQARGGKFLANFGRLNIVHTHELPQVDRPQALTDYLGDEGLNSTGAEVSRIFTPFGLFSEITWAFLENLGEDHHEDGSPETTTITDDNGNPVVVEIHEDPVEDPNSKLRDFANVGRLRFYGDLSESMNLELGMSASHYEPEGLESKTVGGGDLTFRWKPLREGLYRSFIWRSELLGSRIKTPAEVDATGVQTQARGEFRRVAGYSYVEYQPARRWRVGVRGDYVEAPEGAAVITRGASPYVTLYTSEFNRYRLQYRYRDLPLGEHDHTAFLQWTVILGPHGAHPY